MEAAVVTAIESIGLRGKKGLSIDELWEVALLGSKPLPVSLREVFWREFLKRAVDVEFYVPLEGGAGIEPAHGKRKKKSSAQKKIGNDLIFKKDDPRISTAKKAIEARTRFRPYLTLRDPSVGLVGKNLFHLSVSQAQQNVLDMLAEAGPRGMTQSELAKKNNMEGRNFGYVTKVLEHRGLIIKVPAIFRTKPLSDESSGTITTNLVILSRFGLDMHRQNIKVTDFHLMPSLDKDKNMDMLTFAGNREIISDKTDDSGLELSDTDMLENIEASENGQASLFHPNFEDEEKQKDQASKQKYWSLDEYFERICNFLAANPNHIALERGVKVALGYHSTPRGHRQWRKHRDELLRMKCIETFSAESTDGRVYGYVKLLKKYKSSIERQENCEDDTLLHNSGASAILSSFADPDRAKRLETCGNQVAEWNLDRQILSLLASSGSEGLTSEVIEQNLRINTKRNSLRLLDMGRRIKMHADANTTGSIASNGTTKVTRGKQIMNKFIAPAPLMKGIFEANIFPCAISDGNKFQRSLPNISGHWIAPAQDPVMPPSQDPLDTLNKLENTQIIEKVGGNLKSNCSRLSENNALLSKGGSKRKSQSFQTEIGIKRCQWLEEIVKEEKTVLSVEVARMLQAKEKEDGNPNAVLPDQKVWRRAMTAAAAAGKIEIIEVMIPVKSGARTSRRTIVLVPAGYQRGSNFIDAVIARDTELQKCMRNGSSIWERKQPIGAKVHIKEDVKDIFRSKTKGNDQNKSSSVADESDVEEDAQIRSKILEEAQMRGQSRIEMLKKTNDTAKQMTQNGYIVEKMTRIKILHDVLWSILDQRRGRKCKIDPQVLKDAKKGTVFEVSHCPRYVADLLSKGNDSMIEDQCIESKTFVNKNDYRGEKMHMKSLSGSDEDLAWLFSAEELFKSLPIEILCSCFGSRCTNAAALDRLKKQRVVVGQLSRKQLYYVIGGFEYLALVRASFSKSLSLLHRMGLINIVVLCGKSGGNIPKSVGSETSSLFMISRKAYVEDLVVEFEPDSLFTDLENKLDLKSQRLELSKEKDEYGGKAIYEADEVFDEVCENEKIDYVVESPSSKKKPVKRILYEYDVTSKSSREEYWEALHLVSFRGTIGSSKEFLDCFPFCSAREVSYERGWSTRNNIDSVDLERVYNDLFGRTSKLEMHSSVYLFAASQIPPRKASELAHSLQVPFETIVRSVTRIKDRRKLLQNGFEKSGSRLGKLGSRTGGRKPTSKKHLRTKKRGTEKIQGIASDEEVSDIPDDQNEDPLQYSKTPKRKKKWHPKEDRQLLQSWARFIALNGPDKIIRWKHVKGRPKDVLPVSCSNRISSLFRSAETGAFLLRIRELACEVYSRKIALSTAENKNPHKRSLEISDMSETSESTRKRFKISDHRYHDGHGNNLMADEDGNLYDLFPFDDQVDELSMKEILSEIENAVSAAPKRYSNRHGRSLWQGMKTLMLGKANKNSYGQENLFDSLILEIKNKELCVSQGISKAASFSGRISVPSSEVTYVMDMIRSICCSITKLFYKSYKNDIKEKLLWKSKTFLGHFEDTIVVDALLELFGRGHLCLRNSGNLSLRTTDSLTDAPIVLAQYFGYMLESIMNDPQVFSDAYTFKNQELAEVKHTRDKIKLLPSYQPNPSSENIVTELRGGDLACLLTSIYSGNYVLRGSIPRSALQLLCFDSEQNPSVDSRVSGGNFGGKENCSSRETDLKINNILNSIRISLFGTKNYQSDNRRQIVDKLKNEKFGERFICFSKPMQSPAPDARQRRSGVRVKNRFVQFTFGDERVIFQPSLVASNSSYRSMAETEAEKAFNESEVFQKKGSQYFVETMKAIKASKKHGIASDELMKTFERSIPGFDSCSNEEIETNNFKLSAKGEIVAMATHLVCQYGLARCIPSYDDFVLVGSEESQTLVLWYDFTKSGLYQPMKPSSTEKHILGEVMLRPWIDPFGCLIKELWQALLRRTVSIVQRYPGISQAVLVNALSTINPAQAREIIELLCQTGVIYATQSSSSPKAQSVLDSCFEDDFPDRNLLSNVSDDCNKSWALPEGNTIALHILLKTLSSENNNEKRLFVVTENCWNIEDLIPPQVLVPVKDEA